MIKNNYYMIIKSKIQKFLKRKRIVKMNKKLRMIQKNENKMNFGMIEWMFLIG
jgi:hypothetical protein